MVQTSIIRPAREVEAITLPRSTYLISGVLAFVDALAAGLTFVFGGELRGTAVMNGSCRGTALVMLLAGVPVLLTSMWLTGRGSARALFVWFGMTMFLTYNTVLLVLGEPLNRLFLVYEVALALGIAAAVSVPVTAGAERLADRCSLTMPSRGLSVYLGAIVVLNALAWLGRIVPRVFDGHMGKLLDGTGTSVVPTYFGDLAIWLPFLGLGAVWLWQRRPWGYVIAGGAFAFWAVEGLTVAVDQWFGHRADPSSSVASAGAVVPFTIMSVVGIAVLWVFLRHVDDGRGVTG